MFTLYYLFLLCFSATCIFGKAIETRTLQLSETSSVSVAPDICYFQITVQTSDKESASTAYSLNKNSTSALINSLLALDIPASKIQTKNLQLGPTYDYNSGTQILSGFQCSQNVGVSTKKLDIVSTILDTIADSPDSIINSVTFNVENTSNYTKTAKEIAFSNIKKNARYLCSLAGMNLGKPITITEGTSTPSTPVLLRAKIADSPYDSSNSISQGEIVIDYTVSITYEIN